VCGAKVFDRASLHASRDLEALSLEHSCEPHCGRKPLQASAAMAEAEAAPLPELAFRGLVAEDHAAIRRLHEAWFPVRYSAGFYDAVVRGQMVGTGEAIFHLVAEDAHSGEMVGLVTAQLTEARRCGDALFEPSHRFYAAECERVVYVLTLGTVAKYRRRGLGAELLRRCLARAEAEPRCGCVYLHVITHNHAAIAFYERAGFEPVREIPNYYQIDGEDFPCYVYARFLDRARRPPGSAPTPALWLVSSLGSLLPAAFRSCLRRRPARAGQAAREAEAHERKRLCLGDVSASL